MKASTSDDSRANPLCHVWIGGVAGGCGEAGRWTEDAGSAASWGELSLHFVGGVGTEMSAEQVSAMLVDCNVNQASLVQRRVCS